MRRLCTAESAASGAVGADKSVARCPATSRLAVYGVTDVAYISRYWTTFASMGCGEGDDVDFYLFVHYREEDYETYEGHIGKGKGNGSLTGVAPPAGPAGQGGWIGAGGDVGSRFPVARSDADGAAARPAFV